MRDGESQRVGGITLRSRRQAEQSADHERDLPLIGAAVAGDRLLDPSRRVLGDLHSGASQAEQHDAARVPELGGGLGVLVEK